MQRPLARSASAAKTLPLKNSALDDELLDDTGTGYKITDITAVKEWRIPAFLCHK